MSHPSKVKGYVAEVRARDELNWLGFELERTGSVNYSEAAPDLEQKGESVPLRIVATQDHRGPMLYTLNADDLHALRVYSGDALKSLHVVVQVKKRARTFIGGVYAALVKATK